MIEPVTMAGGCACGRVRFTALVHDDKAYLCHCRMCQRTTGSVSIAFKHVKEDEIEWQGEPTGMMARRSLAGPFATNAGLRSALLSSRVAG